MRFFSSPKFTPSCPCGGKWDPVEACEGRCIGLVRIKYEPPARCKVGHCSGHWQAVSLTDVRAVEACRAATRHPTRQRHLPCISSPARITIQNHLGLGCGANLTHNAYRSVNHIQGRRVPTRCQFTGRARMPLLLTSKLQSDSTPGKVTPLESPGYLYLYSEDGKLSRCYWLLNSLLNVTQSLFTSAGGSETSLWTTLAWTSSWFRPTAHSFLTSLKGAANLLPRQTDVSLSSSLPPLHSDTSSGCNRSRKGAARTPASSAPAIARLEIL